mmetsp:Transcript_12897/g.38405  ORF Transcript_12897/g.38405 Transcript_12897/m.38405 type:complete len:143 (+) Transcript_12897:102-530(+)|eukprot:CAMPEP_0119260402 /NCGR_PEP_ID=MMETSP1329-20130426/806_1 /TAXON_ID=114041 /ORGANISM="Genus nov. species nov., Strain RCC1024" /LENGTH=142 /DNA_ID=CAMNT_0007259825 /DNA_START=72 /DNA_END=500 /DNA_ORIENTATION=+
MIDASVQRSLGAMAPEYAETFEAAVAERQAKEDALRASNLKEAAEYLEKFESERRDKLMNITMTQNREKEHDKLEALEQQIEDAEHNPWERVASLVDLQHEVTDAKCDVDRFRSVVIQKKNEVPAVAEGGRAEADGLEDLLG